MAKGEGECADESAGKSGGESDWGVSEDDTQSEREGENEGQVREREKGKVR
jgi:hypothetical protein